MLRTVILQIPDLEVVTDFVKYLGKEDREKKAIESTRIIDRFNNSGSTRAGDIDFLWAVEQDLNIPSIIDRMRYGESSISAGKVLTAWAINRVIDPECAT